MRILIFLLAITLAMPAFAEPDWSLQRDKNGITVWTGLEEGHAIETYKGTVEISAPPASVAAAITDLETLAEWLPDLSEARALDNDLSYIAYSMPFPVKDRDMVQTFAQTARDDGTIVIDTRAVDGGLPPQRKRVRLRDSSLLWVIEPVGEGASRVTCVGYSDPEGGVPPFVINMMIVDAPYKTLAALRAHFD